MYDLLLIDPGADDHQLPIRCSIRTPSELTYYICHSHLGTAGRTGPRRRIRNPIWGH